MKFNWKIIILAMFIPLGCKSPIQPAHEGTAQLKLKFAVPSVAALLSTPEAARSTRALDPATSKIEIRLSTEGQDDIEASATVSGNPPGATLSLEVRLGPQYAITVEAFRSDETEAYARFSTSRAFSADSLSLEALLMPLSTQTIPLGFSLPISGLADKTLFTEATLPTAGAWTISLDPATDAEPMDGTCLVWDGSGRVLASWNHSERFVSINAAAAGTKILLGMYNLSGSYILRVSKAFGTSLSATNAQALQLPGLNGAIVSDSVRLADGSFIMVGMVSNDSSSNSYSGFVTKIHGDGSLAATFGLSQGYTLFSFAESLAPATIPYAVAVDSQGRILVAGLRLIESAGHAFAARFSSQGKLDPSFSDNGWTDLLNEGTEISPLATALAIGPDDSVYAAVNGGTNSNAASVVKLKNDGSHDPDFGDGGTTARTMLSDDGFIWDLELLPGDQLLAVGRHTPDSIAAAAFWLIPAAGSTELLAPVFIDNSGDVLVYTHGLQDGSGGFYLVGTSKSGSDTSLLVHHVSFDDTAWIIDSENEALLVDEFTLPSIARDANGNLLVLYAQPSVSDSISAALFQDEGTSISLVAGFGTNGIVNEIPFAIGQGWGIIGRTRAYSNGLDFSLAGSSSFGATGVAQPATGFISENAGTIGVGPVQIISGTTTYTEATYLDSAGRVIVAGSMVGIDNSRSAFVARFLANGQQDYSFGLGTGSVIGLDTMVSVKALAVDDNGVILVGGTASGDSGVIAVIPANGSAVYSTPIENSIGLSALIVEQAGLVLTTVMAGGSISLHEFEYTGTAAPLQLQTASLPDNPGISNETIHSALMLPGQRVLWYGNGEDVDSTKPYCAVLDLASGTAQLVDTSGLSGSIMTTTAALLRDGSVILAGLANNNTPAAYKLQSTDQDTSGFILQTSGFGESGIASASRSDATAVKGLVALPDGSLYLGASTFNVAEPGLPSETFILRLNANGVFDSTLGSQGYVISTLAGGGYLNITAAGDVWVGGWIRPGLNLNLAVPALMQVY